MAKRSYGEQYYVPEPYDKARGLWVETAGHYISDRAELATRTYRGFVLVYCAKRTGGTYRVGIGGRQIGIRSGDLYVVGPGVPYNPTCGADGWAIWYVHCDGSHARDLLDWAGISLDNPVINVRANAENVEGCFKEVFNLLVEKNIGYSIDASAVLYKLLLELGKGGKGRVSEGPMLFSALADKSATVQSMASAANMSKYHFIREFKKNVGITPWRYVLNHRLARAKEMLRGSDLPIKQIAIDLGFNDPDYFSRLFRKETGQSAREFRADRLGGASPPPEPRKHAAS